MFTYLHAVWARKKESRTSWYFLHPSAQSSRYPSPASVTEYTRHAGPLPLEVYHVVSQSLSFSIFLSVRYNVPGFICSNPNCAMRSIST